MAVQNSSKSILNINCPDNGKNKVYLNPNFSRPWTNNLPSSAIMHVNPNFSRLISNDQCNIQNKNKIYVNPNFIKSRRVCDNIQSNFLCNDIIFDRHSVVNSSHSMVTNNEQFVENKQSPLQMPITHTRYCLVRQNASNKVLNESVPARPKNTFKLNKYKSVPWNDLNKNPANVKNVTNYNSSLASHIGTNTNSVITKSVMRSSVTSKSINEFKFINHNNLTLVKQEKLKNKIYDESYKKVYKLNLVNQSRVRKTKGQLKKNNMPCPLFRKYGKCLRNVRGKCEFLHDKKHVSICRKFIKGLCHDKECLLSHDLTSKKMPTCYFYLQGTCTKTDCPYLHVKLNEKTKVCPDFLKGYCEKGSKCLQRHINVSIEKKSKRPPQGMKASLKKKYSDLKLKVNNSVTQDNKAVFQSTEINMQNSTNSKLDEVKSENNSECRYYQEHRDDDNTNELCEVIKPMRCKLGNLPSFIQL